VSKSPLAMELSLLKRMAKSRNSLRSLRLSLAIKSTLGYTCSTLRLLRGYLTSPAQLSVKYSL
jgi:hypothetical protein